MGTDLIERPDCGLDEPPSWFELSFVPEAAATPPPPITREPVEHRPSIRDIEDSCRRANSLWLLWQLCAEGEPTPGR